MRREQGVLQAAEWVIQTASSKGFVSGHDFSRADKANKVNVGLLPLQHSWLDFALGQPFFRSLFNPLEFELEISWPLGPHRCSQGQARL
jgi:hypothetical protein